MKKKRDRMGIEAWKRINQQSADNLAKAIDELLELMPVGQPVSPKIQKIMKMHQHLVQERAKLDELQERLGRGEEQEQVLRELDELLKWGTEGWDQITK